MNESYVEDSGEVQIQPRRIGLLDAAPWWLISAGLHVVLLLGATLICIEREMQVEEEQVILVMRTPPAPAFEDLRVPAVNTVNNPIVDKANAEDNDKQVVFFPGAELGNHIETDDGAPDSHTPKGVTTDTWAHIEGGSDGNLGRRKDGPKGSSDVLGVGSGGGKGGLYGFANGRGNQNVTIGHGGNQRTIAVSAGALGWLARHQASDGSWKGAAFSDQCVGAKCAGAGSSDCDAGVTGLALLAFLGAGYTHLSLAGETVDAHTPGKTIRYRDVVKKAIRWLVDNQDSDGCVGPHVERMMYNHAIAALALSEAYGMTESQILKDPAQRAINFLIEAKNPYKAWRYTPRNDNDTSVTGWCVMALKSAGASHIQVSESAMKEARGFIEEVTEKNYGKVGYQKLEDAGVKVQVGGKNEGYANHEALAAVGMLVRIFADKDPKDPVLPLSATLLANDLPVWDKAKMTNDYYYWYYGTLALFQFDGPDSGGSQKFWKPWNTAMQAALTKSQHSHADGCAEGSWDADDRWGFEGGRVYATAINCLTMEVYSRYENVFGSLKKAKKTE